MAAKKQSELLRKRIKFTGMLARLILHAEALGYEVAVHEVVRSKCATHGHPKSLHYSGLAADLNLYIDGKYQRATKAHIKLGEYWESLGGSWGGRFQDGNHYSLSHWGRK